MKTVDSSGEASALHDAVAALGIVGMPQLVAAGGGGMVYRVAQKPGHWLAIKVPRDRPGRDPAIGRGVIRREAAILASLNSPHAPSLVLADPQGRFLVRHFVTGWLLEDVIVQGTVHPERRLALAQAILAAARDLFTQTHRRAGGAFAVRDLKPRNLVVDSQNGVVSLIDFGSVRSVLAMLPNRRNPHRIGSGKWRYWSPEQLFEVGDQLGTATDYFALGCTLYAALFGQSPSRNLAAASQWAAAWDLERSRAEVNLYKALWVPAELASFINSCLSFDPASRPELEP